MGGSDLNHTTLAEFHAAAHVSFEAHLAVDFVAACDRGQDAEHGLRAATVEDEICCGSFPMLLEPFDEAVCDKAVMACRAVVGGDMHGDIGRLQVRQGNALGSVLPFDGQVVDGLTAGKQNDL